MSYDPMMDADEYIRKRTMIREAGFEGAGNRWWRGGQRYTLAAAVSVVLWHRSVRQASQAMDRLAESFRRVGERVLHKFRADPTWRRLAGIPDTPSNLYLQLSRYPMLASADVEGAHYGEGEDGN